MSWKNTGFSVAVALGLVLDQLTKVWARSAPALQTRDGWAISDQFLHLVHRENTGAAFSVLSDLPGGAMLGLIAFNAVAVAVGLWLAIRTPAERWPRGIALGVFIAGALGNGIDRVTRGSVTDFIRVHADIEPIYSTLMQWFDRADGPVFNLADVWLIAGVVLILLLDWRHDRGRSKETPHADAR